MTPILDYNSYNSGMKKSLEDKLFFLPVLQDKICTLLDYGCADGQLLKEIQSRDLGIRLIGYDINEDMIFRARENNPGIHFSSHIDRVLSLIDSSRTALLLSSVIHEVYSYQTEEGIEQFWSFVFSTGFKYLVIRDLCTSEETERAADPQDLLKLFVHGYRNQMEDFTNIWGPISSQKKLIHFLMKYRYVSNWEREVSENYLPLNIEDLIDKVGDKYRVVYQKHYTLPFLQEQVEKDFGIVLEDPTHVQLILKLR